MENKMGKVAAELCQAKKPLVVIGAGISVASGIPDFRSKTTGIYTSQTVDINLLNRLAIKKRAIAFWQNFEVFYRMAVGKQQNPGHEALEQLTKLISFGMLINQNVDGLLAKALPQIEAHGHLRTCHCMKCGKVFDLPEIIESREERGVPHCALCSGALRPDVVLFGDDLGQDFNKVFDDVVLGLYDYLLVVGSSMQVYPVAELQKCIKHGAIFDVEKRHLPYGYTLIEGKTEETLPELVLEVGRFKQGGHKVDTEGGK